MWELRFSAELCFQYIKRKISAVGVFYYFALSKRSYSELTRKFIYPLRAFTTHLGLYSIVEIHLVPPTDSGQSVNSDWCCFPLSLSGWGWQGRCMKREKTERKKDEREKNKTSGETDASLASLILSVLKRHSSRLRRCTVKSILNPSAVN